MNNKDLENVMINAVTTAIKEMGMAEFKKTSFFLSNHKGK